MIIHQVVISGNYKFNVADALAKNQAIHEDASDYSWEAASVVQIALNGTSITVNGSGAIVDGSKVFITAAGAYSFSGSLTDGQIIVNTDDKNAVRLILNGVDIRCSTSAPVYIISAKKVLIVLADNTQNTITDGKSYILANPEENEPNAAIFSKADITFYGNASLTVNGNYNDAISGKDGLIIKSGTYTINSVDDGIRGKDYLVIKEGKISVKATGDGLKSDNDEDAARGYVLIENGEINVTAGGDAISGETDVLISDGHITLTSGGGSSRTVAADASAKAIKALVNTIIEDGTFSINSADDALHSNGNLAVNGGDFTISTADDAIHADTSLVINGGNIMIAKSYEGIESIAITINNGNIHITASDDGINAADGSEGSGQGGGPGQGGMPVGNYNLNINGGYIVTNAIGDGFDINGSITMTGGDVIINGPISNANGAIDYDRTFKLSGGFLIAAGSSGMAQAPGTTSTQYIVLMNFSSTIQAGTLFHIQSSAGEAILDFKPTKKYQSVAFSSSKLKKGSTYDVYTGGSSSGAATDGLYQSGAYTPGTKLTSFTVSGVVTRVNK